MGETEEPKGARGKDSSKGPVFYNTEVGAKLRESGLTKESMLQYHEAFKKLGDDKITTDYEKFIHKLVGPGALEEPSRFVELEEGAEEEVEGPANESEKKAKASWY